MGPYRSNYLPQWREEELWYRLDEALLVAIQDPAWAYQLAWYVWDDSVGYPDVRVAADRLMSELMGPSSTAAYLSVEAAVSAWRKRK